MFTFASLYNEPTQWARSLRGGLRHAPEGGGAPLRQARAPVVMRREGGAVFPLAASGGRPRHRARLRPVRVGRRSHERAVASAWRLRPVRVGAAGKCRIRPPGRPVARGGGVGADGTSIPLVSLSPGPAGPEPGPGTRGGPLPDQPGQSGPWTRPWNARRTPRRSPEAGTLPSPSQWPWSWSRSVAARPTR